MSIDKIQEPKPAKERGREVTFLKMEMSSDEDGSNAVYSYKVTYPDGSKKAFSAEEFEENFEIL